MEFLDGQTLASRLESGPLATGEVLKIAIQIADALEKAHRQGIVHRDLKPANVMLTKAGVKLLDFGLAKMHMTAVSAVSSSNDIETRVDPSVRPELTAQGTILGTLQYMAPEQVEGRDADERTDIWAFGLILYEMISGRKPFEASSRAGLIAAILERQPAPMSLPQPNNPIERIISACLEKFPDNRFQTMRICDVNSPGFKREVVTSLLLRPLPAITSALAPELLRQCLLHWPSSYSSVHA